MCDRCEVEVRALGHVCDPAAVASVEARKAESRLREEGLAIAASGVASEEPGMFWEEAIAKLAQSQAAVRGHALTESAPKPMRRFGLTEFQWRLLWLGLNWTALWLTVGFVVGRLTR